MGTFLFTQGFRHLLRCGRPVKLPLCMGPTFLTQKDPTLRDKIKWKLVPTTPYTEYTGWLGRGIDAAELNGLAISLQMPLLLRGKITADNYFPTTLRIPSTDVFKKVASSFVEGDPVYEAMMAINSRPREMLTVKWREREPLILAKTAAEQLRSEEGPRIAVFDLDGFDTHSAQGGTDGEHGEKLSQYDNIVKVLKDNLGEAFDNTLVITLTEFGRKVEENGGYGTEHGYGTAILIAGGLVKNLKFIRTGLVCPKRLCLRGRI